MLNDQAHLDALNLVISVQKDLIEHLKTEVARLKIAGTITSYIPSTPYIYTAPWATTSIGGGTLTTTGAMDLSSVPGTNGPATSGYISIQNNAAYETYPLKEKLG